MSEGYSYQGDDAIPTHFRGEETNIELNSQDKLVTHNTQGYVYEEPQTIGKQMNEQKGYNYPKPKTAAYDYPVQCLKTIGCG